MMQANSQNEQKVQNLPTDKNMPTIEVKDDSGGVVGIDFDAPKSRLGKILMHHYTVALGIILGIAFGILFKDEALKLAIIGNSFGAVVTMVVFPFICGVIIVGLAKILRNPIMMRRFVKMVVTIIISMVISAVIGWGSVMIFQDHLWFNQKSADVLAANTEIAAVHTTTAGQDLTKAREAVEAQVAAQTGSAKVVKPATPAPKVTKSVHSKLVYFLEEITPQNLFKDITEGLTMRIVLSLLLIGIALGTIKTPGSDSLINLLEGVVDVFSTIFHWLLYVLPIGLFFIFANNAASFKPELFNALVAVTALIIGAGVILVVLFNWVLTWWLKIPFWEPFRALRRPLMLALTIMDDTVAIPTSVKLLQRKFGLEKNAVNLTMPLGDVINRQGNVYVLAIITTLTLLFYHMHLDMVHILMLIILTGVLGSFAFGNGGFLIPIFIIISKTIGIPSTLGVSLLGATSILVFWITILVTLMANYAVTAIVAKNRVVHQSK